MMARGRDRWCLGFLVCSITAVSAVLPGCGGSEPAPPKVEPVAATPAAGVPAKKVAPARKNSKDLDELSPRERREQRHPNS